MTIGQPMGPTTKHAGSDDAPTCTCGRLKRAVWRRAYVEYNGPLMPGGMGYAAACCSGCTINAHTMGCDARMLQGPPYRGRSIHLDFEGSTACGRGAVDPLLSMDRSMVNCGICAHYVLVPNGIRHVGKFGDGTS